MITAIDIVIDPDPEMISKAEAANARLLKEYKNGFSLDSDHCPHISALQRYVQTNKLDNIYDAVGIILANEKISAWKLRAYSYYYLPYKNFGVAGIVIEPNDDLLRLQQKLIEAAVPFTVKIGDASAYVTSPEEPDINQPTIDYVASYVPMQTGKKFNPHVTIGIAPEDFLKEMLAEPFEEFIFSPSGISVYQLGNFGTAMKKLKSWTL